MESPCLCRWINGLLTSGLGGVSVGIGKAKVGVKWADNSLTCDSEGNCMLKDMLTKTVTKDERGNSITTEISAGGTKTVTALDANGNKIITIWSPGGTKTVKARDSKGNMHTTTTRPGGTKENLAKDTSGNSHSAITRAGGSKDTYTKASDG